mgnify:CR=1 FL=1
MSRLLILDFDGVVADSELLANSLLAESVTRLLGKPTSTDDSIRLFMGKRWVDCKSAIVTWTGAQLPPDFEERHRAVARPRMRAEVGPVSGVVPFLADMADMAACIASSSNYDWLNHCVDKFGLRASFGSNVFSAQDVAYGKPAPDIFLHAARAMRVDPADCLVIEDSPSGVIGARAAGMRVIGFLGGSHVRPGYGDRLIDAGAQHLAKNYAEVREHLLRWRSGWP